MKRPKPGLPPEVTPGISYQEWAVLMMLFTTVASGHWQEVLMAMSLVYFAVAFWKMPPGHLENSWKQLFRRVRK